MVQRTHGMIDWIWIGLHFNLRINWKPPIQVLIGVWSLHIHHHHHHHHQRLSTQTETQLKRLKWRFYWIVIDQFLFQKPWVVSLIPIAWLRSLLNIRFFHWIWYTRWWNWRRWPNIDQDWTPSSCFNERNARLDSVPSNMFQIFFSLKRDYLFLKITWWLLMITPSNWWFIDLNCCCYQSEKWTSWDVPFMLSLTTYFQEFRNGVQVIKINQNTNTNKHKQTNTNIKQTQTTNKTKQNKTKQQKSEIKISLFFST